RHLALRLAHRKAYGLELQATLACAVRDRLDAAVIEEPTTIEHDSVNTCGLGALGDKLADSLGTGGLRRTLASLLEDGVLKITGRNKCMPLDIIDDLAIHVGI